jgi:hypothetical protein
VRLARPQHGHWPPMRVPRRKVLDDSGRMNPTFGRSEYAEERLRVIRQVCLGLLRVVSEERSGASGGLHLKSGGETAGGLRRDGVVE